MSQKTSEASESVKHLWRSAKKDVGTGWAVIVMVIMGLMAAGITATIFAAVWTLIGLILLLAWNLGVVGLVGASGGSVAKIGFWTAFGAAAVVTTLRSIVSAGRSKSA